MGKNAFVVCTVAILGIISAGTGFAAEVTRVKASQLKVVLGECYYPRSAAFGLGLAAAAALLLAQLIISFATGCICCNRTSKTFNFNCGKARAFNVFSRCTFVIGFILLVAASVLSHHSEESSSVYRSGYYFYYYCRVVKPGVYAGGAVLAAASVILGILYYLTLNEEKNTTGSSGNPSLPNQGNGSTAGQLQTSQIPASV